MPMRGDEMGFGFLEVVQQWDSPTVTLNSAGLKHFSAVAQLSGLIVRQETLGTQG
jgi:hypothetical protein